MLLENFPVRGGFSQLYTSHELYCYKLKSCKPELLAAQGLGTVLRLVTSGTRTMHSDPRPMPQHSPRHNAPSPGTRRRTQAHTQTATRMLAVCLIRISADSKGSVTKVSFFVDGKFQAKKVGPVIGKTVSAHGCAHGCAAVHTAMHTARVLSATRQTAAIKMLTWPSPSPPCATPMLVGPRASRNGSDFNRAHSDGAAAPQVVVMGSGQNGLIATRLFGQFAAKVSNTFGTKHRVLVQL